MHKVRTMLLTQDLWKTLISSRQEVVIWPFKYIHQSPSRIQTRKAPSEAPTLLLLLFQVVLEQRRVGLGQ